MKVDREITLHGYFRSSASFRVRIALNLKEVDYKTVPHHLRRGEQRASEYLQINPQGLVPSLEIDGHVLYQSLAIIDYLDEMYPEPALLPNDAAGRARVRALAQIVSCDIHPIDNLRVLQYLREILGQNEESVQQWYNHWIADGFTAFEILLSKSTETGRFCHHDKPSVADICLIPQVVNARNFNLDLSLFPNIVRIFNEAMTLPAVERALPNNQSDPE